MYYNSYDVSKAKRGLQDTMIKFVKPSAGFKVKSSCSTSAILLQKELMVVTTAVTTTEIFALVHYAKVRQKNQNGLLVKMSFPVRHLLPVQSLFLRNRVSFFVKRFYSLETPWVVQDPA